MLIMIMTLEWYLWALRLRRSASGLWADCGCVVWGTDLLTSLMCFKDLLSFVKRVQGVCWFHMFLGSGCLSISRNTPIISVNLFLRENFLYLHKKNVFCIQPTAKFLCHPHTHMASAYQTSIVSLTVSFSLHFRLQYACEKERKTLTL